MQYFRILLTASLLLCCFFTSHSDSYSIALQSDTIETGRLNRTIQLSIPDGLPLEEPGIPDLLWLTVFINAELPLNPVEVSWQVVLADTLYIEHPLSPTQPDFPTLAEPADGRSQPIIKPGYTEAVYPTQNYRLEFGGTANGETITVIRWCPFIYHPKSQRLIHIRQARLSWNNVGSGSPIHTFRTFGDLHMHVSNQSPSLEKSAWTDFRSIQTGLPLDIDYVIVTSENLVNIFHPLARWRLQQGYRPGIAFIENIEAAYPGEDRPAQIREYLREAYQTGLEFCLLGGDESVIPIRYAYFGYTDQTPSLYDLQVCDLYYADFDGDWDTDGDGVYGEYRQDDADLIPEIAIGRLPLASADGLNAAIEKIIAYETSPGGDDPAYLTSALFTCADEMRDWKGGVGQHALIADEFPEEFTRDLTTQSENPLGSEPAPINPEGEDYVSQAGLGWGWFCHINHGKSDGIVLRSAGLNTWPKSYVFSEGVNGDGHGHLTSLAENTSPGIVISVSCDGGGFDLDGPSFPENSGLPFCESLLAHPNGGAVAMIAFSRWGWVASSYKIIERFVQYAFDNGLRPQLGTAFHLAKCDYLHYRDQILGLNFLGDPALHHWRAAPKPLTIDAPATVTADSGPVMITVSDESGPVKAARVTILYGDTLLYQGLTNSAGQELWDPGPDRLGGYTITVSKAGYLPATRDLIVPIATGLKDDTDNLPASFSVAQNYPNPFNAGTTIEYQLEIPGRLTISIVDILGRSVRTLLDQTVAAGHGAVHFNGRTDAGTPLPSGVYFYRICSRDKSETKKMILMK